jgi:Txe/YoeB family toxin of toxin-antitoxin system
MWKLVYTKQAQKDAIKIKESGLKSKVEELLSLIKSDPYISPPPFEKLRGDLLGLFSRRINIQHRLVYQIYEEEKIIKVIRMWTHYE